MENLDLHLHLGISQQGMNSSNNLKACRGNMDNSHIERDEQRTMNSTANTGASLEPTDFGFTHLASSGSLEASSSHEGSSISAGLNPVGTVLDSDPINADPRRPRGLASGRNRHAGLNPRGMTDDGPANVDFMSPRDVVGAGHDGSANIMNLENVVGNSHGSSAGVMRLGGVVVDDRRGAETMNLRDMVGTSCNNANLNMRPVAGNRETNLRGVEGYEGHYGDLSSRGIGGNGRVNMGKNLGAVGGDGHNYAGLNSMRLASGGRMNAEMNVSGIRSTVHDYLGMNPRGFANSGWEGVEMNMRDMPYNNHSQVEMHSRITASNTGLNISRSTGGGNSRCSFDTNKRDLVGRAHGYTDQNSGGMSGNGSSGYYYYDQNPRGMTGNAHSYAGQNLRGSDRCNGDQNPRGIAAGNEHSYGDRNPRGIAAGNEHNYGDQNARVIVAGNEHNYGDQNARGIAAGNEHNYGDQNPRVIAAGNEHNYSDLNPRGIATGNEHNYGDLNPKGIAAGNEHNYGDDQNLRAMSGRVGENLISVEDQFVWLAVPERRAKRQQLAMENGYRLYNNPSKRCTNCGTNDTPMWRKGPLGHKTLCNACGLKFKKEEEKRKARTTGQNGGGGASGNQGFVFP